ncbi:MAG: gas vesicle protein [Candidatus Bipolaricaulota bacterium]
MPLEATKGDSSGGGLPGAVDRILEKGLVINADITVSVADVELLGVKVRAALASFDTAAEYGLEFPSGTKTDTEAWKEAQEGKESCPQCGKEVLKQTLLNESCPWCGWKSAKSRASGQGKIGPGLENEMKA